MIGQHISKADLETAAKPNIAAVTSPNNLNDAPTMLFYVPFIPSAEPTLDPLLTPKMASDILFNYHSANQSAAKTEYKPFVPSTNMVANSEIHVVPPPSIEILPYKKRKQMIKKAL